MARYVKITEVQYFRALGTVPPLCHSAEGFLVGEPAGYSEEGALTFWPFLCVDGVHYAGPRPVTVAEFQAIDARAAVKGE